jgi:hypothetical protein
MGDEMPTELMLSGNLIKPKRDQDDRSGDQQRSRLLTACFCHQEERSP